MKRGARSGRRQPSRSARGSVSAAGAPREGPAWTQGALVGAQPGGRAGGARLHKCRRRPRATSDATGQWGVLVYGHEKLSKMCSPCCVQQLDIAGGHRQTGARLHMPKTASTHVARFCGRGGGWWQRAIGGFRGSLPFPPFLSCMYIHAI